MASADALIKTKRSELSLKRHIGCNAGSTSNHMYLLLQHKFIERHNRKIKRTYPASPLQVYGSARVNKAFC